MLNQDLGSLDTRETSPSIPNKLKQSQADALIDRLDLPVTPTLRGKNAERASVRDHKPRIGHIWLFLVITTCFSLNSNYVLGELNQMKMLLTVKMDWGDGSDK